MKYIRTNDGRIIDLTNWFSQKIICVNSETNEEKEDICYQKTWFEQHGDTCEYKNEYISHNTQVLKEADTIEELCDEFVIVGTNWQQIIDLESARYNLKRPKELKVYGAIWTDKGLIYVAKMNDKGELELL